MTTTPPAAAPSREDDLFNLIANLSETLDGVADALTDLMAREGLTPALADLLVAVDCERMDLVTRRRAELYRTYRAQCEKVCTDCRLKDNPVTWQAKHLDADGVLTSISLKPGQWAHSYEDAWWPCRAGALHDQHARAVESLAKLLPDGRPLNIRRARQMTPDLVGIEGWYWAKLKTGEVVMVYAHQDDPARGWWLTRRHPVGDWLTGRADQNAEALYGPLDAPAF